MYDTTALSELKQGKRFTWGKIISIMEIGPYSIASYHPRNVEGCVVLQTINKDKVQFHAWIDGKDCSESFESLDAALAGCIAYKIEGSNHRADRYFIQSMKK
jgi:hypothetical protein